MKNTWIVDIEVYPNAYFCGVKDYKNNKIYTFEISEWVDERKEFYNVFSKYDGYLISFNGVQYDNVVNSFILKEWDKLKNLPVKELNQKLKWFSDKVIQDDFETIKWYKWYKNNWIDIDLYLYWSKMLRQSKQLSLKALAVQLGWDEIQELPYSPDTLLTKEQLEDVKRYNLRNDLGITEMLFKKMKEDIELRHYIKKEYDLECWSMDAPKIAGELLIKNYCEQTFNNQTPSLQEYINDFKKTRHRSYVGQIKDVISDFNIEFKIPQFKKLYEVACNSYRDFNYKFPLLYENTAIICSYGIGGAHTIQTNECYESNNDYVIVTSDFASLYPNIIINWKCIRYEEVLNKYIDVKTERLLAKKNKLKKKDTLLKLILNSVSGLLDNEHSPLYYPEGALKMRIIGQLILTKTAEIAMLNGWQVISLNTDGIECKIPKNDLQKYKDALKEAEQLFNIELEHDVYQKIIYSNVNNYIAITEKGKIKRKGAYFKLTRDEDGKSEIPLGDSVNENIICRALTAYFVNGIDIAEYITNPEKYGNHIYDYCLSKKINKGYTVWHNQTQVQNLNRYYFNKNAPYLYKQKKGKNTFEHVNKDSGVILFNKFEDKPWEEYKINYPYYISKTRKIIDALQEKQRQGTLF